MISLRNKITDFKQFTPKDYCMNITKLFRSLILGTLSTLIIIPTFAQNKKDSSSNAW